MIVLLLLQSFPVYSSQMEQFNHRLDDLYNIKKPTYTVASL